ncbi:MAG: EI24 domain-containing protein [Ignavibacteria bacterium]|nr:EI24 domain-containing protein [Ignavibacteria bacterium]
MSYPFKTMKLFFKNPKILLLSVVPLILNFLIYGTIFYLAVVYLYDHILLLSESVFGSGGAFHFIINYLLFIATFFVVLFVCYLLFVIAGGLLCAPFNEAISQRVEKIKSGSLISSSKGFLSDVFSSIKSEVLKLSLLFSITVPLFLLGLLPFVGFIFAGAATIFSMLYNTLDFIDYPLARRNTGLKQKIKLVLSNKPLSLGFGATAFLITFLPGINIVLRPMLVVAGTSLYFDRFSQTV